MEYRFFVKGHPIPQARPRFAKRNGFVTVKDADDSKIYKHSIYAQAWKSFSNGGEKLLSGALTLELTVYRMFPSSWSRIKGERAMKGNLMPDTMPDLDNYIKIALDGIGLKGYPKIIFNNDSQIVQIIAKKRFVRMNMVEGMDICIREYVNEE